MYYIVQNKLFAENEWDDLIRILSGYKLDYEIVEVDEIDSIDFQTKRNDVFCFGSMKMARLSKKYDWNPGCIMTENHDFKKYREHYGENLLNYDSHIFRFMDDIYFKGSRFIRPTKDSKLFDGKIYTSEEWKNFQEKFVNGKYSHLVDKNTEIQIASVKETQKEFRFFVIDGKIITGSLYKMGKNIIYSEIIDTEALEFCKTMIDIFQIAKGFTIDIGLCGGKWKIIECGCLNCSGFYRSNIAKLIDEIEKTQW